MGQEPTESCKVQASELTITPCDHDDETIYRLLREGKTMLISGLLALNEGSYIIKVVRVIRAQPIQDQEESIGAIHGWIRIEGNVPFRGLYYAESDLAKTGNTIILNIAMTSVPCFAAVVNDDIAEKTASRQNLGKAIDFALKFLEKN